jgi:hypothetical protein
MQPGHHLPYLLVHLNPGQHHFPRPNPSDRPTASTATRHFLARGIGPAGLTL